jgi:hypothetical protein
MTQTAHTTLAKIRAVPLRYKGNGNNHRILSGWSA